MARIKRVTAADLAWMIQERTQEVQGFMMSPVTVAIIPDADLGWRTVLSQRTRRRLTSAATKKLQTIETELRASYGLAAE
jgi:hypothetical protein